MLTEPLPYKFVSVNRRNIEARPHVQWIFFLLCTPLSLNFPRKESPRSILVTSLRGCPQQVVRVGIVDFGERHDRRPTNQVSPWQAERGSGPTRATFSRGSLWNPREEIGHVGEDATRKLLPWNLSFYQPRGRS